VVWGGESGRPRPSRIMWGSSCVKQKGRFGGFASLFPNFFHPDYRAEANANISQARLASPLIRSIGQITDSDDVCTLTEGALHPRSKSGNIFKVAL